MKDFFAGVSLLPRGLAILRRSPRLLLIGAIPPLVTTLLLVAGLVALANSVGGITEWLTPFADGWPESLRGTIRALAGVAIFAAAGVVGVITFTAVTLLIGGPFYEHIAEKVADSVGDADEPGQVSWLTLTARGLRDSAVLIGASVLCTLPLFLAGFIPVIGQTVVPVLVVLVGGWLLALELVGVAFSRRGLRLRDRHRALRERRRLALGVGVPCYLLCAIPFAAVIVMPVAVAAGTLLAREVLGTAGEVLPTRVVQPTPAEPGPSENSRPQGE